MLRIGMGYDVHAFAKGRKLVLGGVQIEHDRGLLGHSDADVLTHALMDAILGAMRAGDIGEHFPDTDPAYRGADSLELLRHVGVMMREAGWTLVDADCVIVAQAPRLSPHRESMRERLAKSLGVEVDAIGVKSTTTERLGFAGREEGIGAYAVALLERGSNPASGW
jgi:2-C-methyl-D-erythritol 2,4-cyclodiphosphate synthase